MLPNRGAGVQLRTFVRVPKAGHWGPVAAGLAAKGAAAAIPYSRPGLAGINAWATPGPARNALANLVGRYGQYGVARSGSEVANVLNPAQQQGDIRDRLESAGSAVSAS